MGEEEVEEVPRGEQIVRVHWRSAGEGSGCSFETSAGTLSPWYGAQDGEVQTLAASDGCHITGLTLPGASARGAPPGLEEAPQGLPVILTVSGAGAAEANGLFELRHGAPPGPQEGQAGKPYYWARSDSSGTIIRYEAAHGKWALCVEGEARYLTAGAGAAPGEFALTRGQVYADGELFRSELPLPTVSAEPDRGRCGVVFKILNAQAVSVDDFSDFPEQEEALFFPGAKFQVKAFRRLTELELNEGQPQKTDEWDIKLDIAMPRTMKLQEARQQRYLLIVLEQLQLAEKKVRDGCPPDLRPTWKRGMRLSWMNKFLEDNRGEIETQLSRGPKGKERYIMMTMYDVVDRFIKPATKNSGGSYAELHPEAPVDYFVSHWWGEEFPHFVKALGRFALAVRSEDPSFWICSFANNQHEVNLGGTLQESPFNLALQSKSCKGVCMILDRQLTPLSRVWCLYEVMRAHDLDLPFDVATENGCLTRCRPEDLRQGVAAGPGMLADIKELGRKLLQIRISDADASEASDKVLIFREIDARVGREQLESCIRATLAPALQQAVRMSAHAASSGDLNALMLRLEAAQRDARRVAWFGRTEQHRLAQTQASPGRLAEELRRHPWGGLAQADDRGRTPLHYAARYNGGVVACLLERSADAEAADEDGVVPLHWAAEGQSEASPEAVRALLDAGARVDACDGLGLQALHFAAMRGDAGVPMARLLLEARAPADAPTHAGATPLLWAAAGNGRGLVELLVERGAQAGARARDGRTALHEAAKGGYAELVAALLDGLGLDLGARTSAGFTALHWAALGGHEAVVRELLARGAEAGGQDAAGRTPLHRACEAGSVAAATRLLDARGDVAAVDHELVGPLHLAARSGCGDLVQLLVGRGAPAAAPERGGARPLHWAAAFGHVDVVERLLEAAAVVGAATSAGATALHAAAAEGHVETARRLILARAQVAATDGAGRTARDVAGSGCSAALAELLAAGR